MIGTAWTPNLYAYNIAFVNQDANYAAALAFLLGIVIMIVSYIVQLSRANGRSAAHDRRNPAPRPRAVVASRPWIRRRPGRESGAQARRAGC